MCDLGAMIQKHLRDHHGPAVALELAGPAELAVDSVNSADPTKEIRLPNGEILTALEIVERLNLECFLEEEEWCP